MGKAVFKGVPTPNGRSSQSSMRFLLYNIRYGTGAAWHYHLPLPFSGFLRRTQRNLDRIAGFLKEVQPDIVGLVEVDNGSYRSDRRNQAAFLAKKLGHSHVYESKYGKRALVQRIPILREQGNAFITNQAIKAKDFHYFDKGLKRLVIELEFESFVVFLVHLSLLPRHRLRQLTGLYSLFRETTKPVIVAGDFNALWGEHELHLFQAACGGLLNANADSLPTFPSHMPRLQLDFVLYSPELRMTAFHIPDVRYSDHMPLVFDFELPVAEKK
jgi:endonuclease/exonuclease/phosphatase family metal-dependent hydrolase